LKQSKKEKQGLVMQLGLLQFNRFEDLLKDDDDDVSF